MLFSRRNPLLLISLGEPFDRGLATSLVENGNLYDSVAQTPGNYDCEKAF